MAKGDDIQKRLIDFAVSIINLTTKLSKSSAESANDFIHKLRIVLKELNET